jgi:hypothetical protein
VRHAQASAGRSSTEHDTHIIHSAKKPREPRFGKYGLAREEIAGALAQDKIAITDQERGGMLALAARIRMDDLVPHALGFCPQAR